MDVVLAAAETGWGYLVSLFEFLVRSDVSGAVTWLGTILGGIGLRLTYVQARDAKTEARTAAATADAAVKAVKNATKLISLADSAHIGAQIHMMEEAVSRQDFSRLHLIFMNVRRGAGFILLRANAPEDITGRIRRTLQVINTQISYARNSDQRFKVALLSKALSGLSDNLILIEHEIQQSSDTEHHNEVH